ncbi:glycosyl hydrolase family 8 [Streptomyces liangshanensis]|uniref:glycosyl hydrolase family 8 n=1 Tax=Streptomyces liangshanensis TaxID=2717324 RepID=UPI0036DE9B9C
MSRSRRARCAAALSATAVLTTCVWTGLTPAAGAADGPAVPFGSHSFAYAAGTLAPSGGQAAADRAVIDFYTKWKSNFIKQNCGNGWYEVYAADADHPYVAEAQGYGLVITALMAGADADAKKIFDGILKYVLAHPSVNNPDLHAAEQDTGCRSVNGSDSATDGDLDIAYGLLLAHKQWGSGGTYNYQSLANRRINAIKASEVHSGSKLMKLGDWSSGSYDQISRTSDWIPGHFKAFRKATGDTTWDAVLTKTQSVIGSLQSKHASATGLLPDFVVNTTTTPKPAAGEVLEDAHDGDYNWNACRDPWRLGTDAVVNNDSASRTAVRKMNSWIKTKAANDPAKIRDGYKLNGTSFGTGNEPAFFAPFAVAAMTDPASQAWLDALWQKMLATTPSSTDYYSTSVQLQTMLVVTHNYWTP